MSILYLLFAILWEGRQRLSKVDNLQHQSSHTGSHTLKVHLALHPLALPAANKRSLGEEHRYRACIHWFLFFFPSPRYSSLVPTPNIRDLRSYWARRPSLYLIAFSEFDFPWLPTHFVNPCKILPSTTFLGNVIHSWTVCVEKFNLFCIWSQPPANYTLWSSVLLLPEKGYDHPHSTLPLPHDFIDLSYISLLQAEELWSARNY